MARRAGAGPGAISPHAAPLPGFGSSCGRRTSHQPSGKRTALMPLLTIQSKCSSPIQPSMCASMRCQKEALLPRGSSHKDARDATVVKSFSGMSQPTLTNARHVSRRATAAAAAKGEAIPRGLPLATARPPPPQIRRACSQTRRCPCSPRGGARPSANRPPHAAPRPSSRRCRRRRAVLGRASGHSRGAASARIPRRARLLSAPPPRSAAAAPPPPRARRRVLSDGRWRREFRQTSRGGRLPRSALGDATRPTRSLRRGGRREADHLLGSV